MVAPIYPTTLSFGEVIIGIGDGASPEVFAEPCGFSSKSFDLDAASSEAIIAACNDPEAAPWTVAGITSKGWTVAGDGVLAQESYETWRAFFDGGVPLNVRIQLGELGYWEGPGLCTKLAHAVALASDAGKVKLTVNLRNADAAVWTPVAP